MTALVDDIAFTRPLVKVLRGHVGVAAESIAAGRGERSHAGVEEHRPAAAVWVYMTVLTAWAEDHALIAPRLRSDAAAGRKLFLDQPGATMAAWLAYGFADLCAHPATACLLDPRYTPIRAAAPSEEVLRGLVDWWTGEAPPLVYPRGDGPESITGWLPGDLLQAVSDERSGTYALCQTPWWVADFLLEQTMLPALAEFPGETLRLIDPACGTGHILIRAFVGLVAAYTSGALGPPDDPVTAVRRALDGVHGVELDPLTAAVARMRLTVVAGAFLADAGHVPSPLRLDAIPAWVRPKVAVGNALLAGLDDPCPPGTIVDDTAEYPGILKRGTYHAVVANPPYKVERRAEVRDAIREAYREVCSGRFTLAVPFTKLLFDLAVRGESNPGVLAYVAPKAGV